MQSKSVGSPFKLDNSLISNNIGVCAEDQDLSDVVTSINFDKEPTSQSKVHLNLRNLIYQEAKPITLKLGLSLINEEEIEQTDQQDRNEQIQVSQNTIEPKVDSDETILEVAEKAMSLLA